MFETSKGEFEEIINAHSAVIIVNILIAGPSKSLGVHFGWMGLN